MPPICRLIRDAVARDGRPAPVLAREIGVAHATLWRWVNGERTPEAKHLAKLADVLQVSPDTVLTASSK